MSHVTPTRTRSDAVLHRFVVAALGTAMVVTGAALCFTVLYFVRGSLEMFPTEEDHAKVRTVTGAISAILIATELGLWFLLRRITRRDGASSSTS